jgi:hypothetical protein
MEAIMDTYRHWQRVILAFLIAGLLLIPGAAAQDSALSRTQVRVFAAYQPDGLSDALRLVASFDGTCRVGSLMTPWRPDAFRCTAADGLLYDPCFSAATGERDVVACAELPWNANVALMTLSEPLPVAVEMSPAPLAAALPWALELENGDRCLLNTGATLLIAGLRANYGCESAAIILGDPDRSAPVWQVFILPLTGRYYMEQIGVAVAWY